MKKGKVLAICMSMLVLCVGCVSGKRTFGKTPEEIEGWICSGNNRMVSQMWEYDWEAINLGDNKNIKEIGITYTDMDDKNVFFRFESTGLYVYGIADKETHQMEDVVIENRAAVINSLVGFMGAMYSNDSSYIDVLAADGLLLDVKNTGLILSNLFNLSAEDAKTICSEMNSNEIKSLMYEDTEYNMMMEIDSYVVKYYITTEGNMDVFKESIEPYMQEN